MEKKTLYLQTEKELEDALKWLLQPQPKSLEKLSCNYEFLLVLGWWYETNVSETHRKIITQWYNNEGNKVTLSKFDKERGLNLNDKYTFSSILSLPVSNLIYLNSLLRSMDLVLNIQFDSSRSVISYLKKYLSKDIIIENTSSNPRTRGRVLFELFDLFKGYSNDKFSVISFPTNIEKIKSNLNDANFDSSNYYYDDDDIVKFTLISETKIEDSEKSIFDLYNKTMLQHHILHNNLINKLSTDGMLPMLTNSFNYSYKARINGLSNNRCISEKFSSNIKSSLNSLKFDEANRDYILYNLTSYDVCSIKFNSFGEITICRD